MPVPVPAALNNLAARLAASGPIGSALVAHWGLYLAANVQTMVEITTGDDIASMANGFRASNEQLEAIARVAMQLKAANDAIVDELVGLDMVASETAEEPAP